MASLADAIFAGTSFTSARQMLLPSAGAKTDLAHVSTKVSQAEAEDTRHNRAEHRCV
ncbi:MAG TPA: hypothetical protein VIY29_23145 [Ktedonobacteraceae bacterium]